jgi:hypothetical protein
MSYSFAIIGGGWYGCHIATSLRALGFGVTLFEQNNRLLHEASGNNQFRLHQGFHYPRHYATRMQSRDGFSRFVERYPGLSRPVAENLYAVPRGDSLIDFLTYRIIMTSSGIDFSELPETPPGLANIEGCLKATERVLLTGRARAGLTAVEWLTNKEPEADWQRIRRLMDRQKGVEGQASRTSRIEPTLRRI